jgi:hypothetical protein
MLKWIYSNLTISLSSQAFVMHQHAIWWNKRSQLITQNFAPAKAVDNFQSQCEQMARVIHEKNLTECATTLVISDELVRQWVVEPPQNVESLDDLKAAVSARFQALYGDSPAAWQIEADWKTDSPFLASAIPNNLAFALDGLAKKCQLQWRQIAPHSVMLFNRWRNILPPNTWMVTFENGRLSLTVTNAQRVVCAYRHISCETDEISSEQNFITLLNREALRMNLPSPKQVYFPRILNEFNWLKHTKDHHVIFKVLSIIYPDVISIVPAVELTPSEA